MSDYKNELPVLIKCELNQYPNAKFTNIALSPVQSEIMSNYENAFNDTDLFSIKSEPKQILNYESDCSNINLFDIKSDLDHYPDEKVNSASFSCEPFDVTCKREVTSNDDENRVMKIVIPPSLLYDNYKGCVNVGGKTIRQRNGHKTSPFHENCTDIAAECTKTEQRLHLKNAAKTAIQVNRRKKGKARYGDAYFEEQIGIQITNKNRSANRVRYSRAYRRNELTRVTTYRCHHCDKIFSRRSYIVKHVQHCPNGKPYRCDYCAKSFNKKPDLKRHVTLHTAGCKLYVCDYCKTSFSEKGNFVRHIMTHTNERPHNCRYCGKAFIEKGHLTRHLRIHTGEKPYTCDACKKQFNDRSHIIRHITSIHKITN